MGLADNLKDKANELKDQAAEKIDILGQRADGEADKASADNKVEELKGEAKIKTSEARDKLQ